MATTLPSFTRTIDNAFVETWYEIRAEAIDNILNATVIWAALNAAGCMKPQEGSEIITRTIKYASPSASDIAKGDVLPSGELETETMAIWKWRTVAAAVQRDTFDDQKNRGKFKIKDYVGKRLGEARDSLEQKFESSMTNAHVTGETGKLFQGLNDMLPPIATRSTGTYGGITRPTTYADSGNGVYKATVGNTWWGSNYLPGVLASIEDDLLTDMKKLYNSTHNNQVPPNLILTTQTIFEIYEEFALDISQIIKDEGTMLADLGFEVLRFKGKPLIWAPGITANHMKMINTNFVEIVYDPGFWFDMTDWKPVPLSTTRIAHILNFANMLTDQPRRHGQLEYA